MGSSNFRVQPDDALAAQMVTQVIARNRKKGLVTEVIAKMTPKQIIQRDKNLLQEGKLRVIPSLPLVHHSAQVSVGALFHVHAFEFLPEILKLVSDLILELAEILADIR